MSNSQPIGLILAAVAFASISSLRSDAGTISSSSLTQLGSTGVDIDVTDTLDWGAFTGVPTFLDSGSNVSVDFDGTGVTNRHSSPDSGTVTFTEDGTLGSKDTLPSGSPGHRFTFSNGVNPMSGTSVELGGDMGNIAPGESMFTLDFDSVGGPGERLLSLYVGSTRPTQGLEIVATLTDSSGATDTLMTAIMGNGIGNPGTAAIYELAYASSDPNATLSVSFTSTNTSSFGEFQMAGFTIEAVGVIPEPSSGLVLSGLALCFGFRRRSRK